MATDPVPFPRRAAAAHLSVEGLATGLGNAGNHQAVPFTYDQFRFANTVPEDEAKDLFETLFRPWKPIVSTQGVHPAL